MARAQEPTAMLEMQHQIRANAASLQDYFSDLYSWEKAIGQEDASRTRSRKRGVSSAVPPPRARQSAVIGGASAGHKKGESEAAAADAHTYDKGYTRWEKFDVEAALREADYDTLGQMEAAPETLPPTKASASFAKARKALKQHSEPSTSKPSETKSRAEIEKEEGNAHYKRGDFVAAIKSYTRCLGHDAQNAVVLSNRAMAFIKNREFGKAEDDCTLALKSDPLHVKSYLRRGTARNALGKHRLALLDFEKCATLDPRNRQVQTQLASTRELMRTAIKRAPKRTEFGIQVVNIPAPVVKDKAVKLEIVEDGANEDKENTPVQSKASSTTDAKEAGKEQTLEATETAATTSSAAQASSAPSQRLATTIQLPSLPKKAPTTSYEFTRVWKTFAPKGDADRKAKLLELRARYLRMVQPTSVRSIFKSAIEADLLCEIFAVFRQGLLAGDTPSRVDAGFVLQFAQELAHVPRFSMTVMFLSDKEKLDMQWVVDALRTALGSTEEGAQAIAKLEQTYELS